MSQKFGYSSNHFLIWFVANIIGFGVMGALLLVFPFILGRAGFHRTTFFLAIPISLAQWIALRRSLQTSNLWILTIPIGIPISFIIMEAIHNGIWIEANDDSLFAMNSMIFVVGLVIGLLQWIILRKQLLRASVWIFGSAIAVAGSFWLILVTGLIDQSGIIAYIVVGLVYSGVTGLILSELLAYNNQSQPSLANDT